MVASKLRPYDPDPVSMNQENGAPRPIRRPPSASGSVILIVLMLFMMLGGGSQRVSQGDTGERLKYQLCEV
jgi:hypothetical protein